MIICPERRRLHSLCTMGPAHRAKPAVLYHRSCNPQIRRHVVLLLYVLISQSFYKTVSTSPFLGLVANDAP